MVLLDNKSLHAMTASNGQAVRTKYLVQRFIRWLAIVLMLLVSVGIPRLILAGGTPATDEGIYAYYAQLIHASLAERQALPDTGTLMLYPLLTSWVFRLSANPIVLLRLVDLLAAVAGGYLLYRVLSRESNSFYGGILVSGLFIFTMNSPIFIQYGYKNSFQAAFVPMLAALSLGLNEDPVRREHRWLAVGALLAVATLLRETLFPLAILGILAGWYKAGNRHFVGLLVGFTGTATIMLASILASGRSLSSTINAYKEAGLMYAALADQRNTLFIGSGLEFLRTSVFALLLAGIALIIIINRTASSRRITSPAVILFWLLATTLPLLEPIGKIGFPYHFGVTLFGLSGITALGWRNLCESNPRIREYSACAFLCFMIILTTRSASPVYKSLIPQARSVISSIMSNQWPNDLRDRSNYLLAADMIRIAAPGKGTLAISGYMNALFPLTGKLPSSPRLSNLTNSFIKSNSSISRLQQELEECSPEIVMTSSRDLPGVKEIERAIIGTGIYELVGNIPISEAKDYGNFGGKIFRTRKTPARCQN